MAFRPFLLAAAVSLPMSLVACGGGDDQPTPEGTHYHYVTNQVFIPTTNTQAREYGLDLNADGTVDNQLGMVLSTLAGMGFKLQDTIDTAVAEGSIILLVDFQTKDFTNTTAAGIQVFLGDMPTPAACNGTETYDPVAKTGCKHHLDGNGSFSIDPNSPTDAALAGKIVNGTFTGGSTKSNLSLQIALGGTDAIKLDLIGARAKASGITDSMIGTGTSGGVILAGAVTSTTRSSRRSRRSSSRSSRVTARCSRRLRAAAAARTRPARPSSACSTRPRRTARSPSTRSRTTA